MSFSSPQEQSHCLERLFLLFCWASWDFTMSIPINWMCGSPWSAPAQCKTNRELCYVCKTEMLLQTCTGLLGRNGSSTLQESNIQNLLLSTFAGFCLDKMNLYNCRLPCNFFLLNVFGKRICFQMESLCSCQPDTALKMKMLLWRN